MAVNYTRSKHTVYQGRSLRIGPQMAGVIMISPLVVLNHFVRCIKGCQVEAFIIWCRCSNTLCQLYTLCQPTCLCHRPQKIVIWFSIHLWHTSITCHCFCCYCSPLSHVSIQIRLILCASGIKYDSFSIVVGWKILHPLKMQTKATNISENKFIFCICVMFFHHRARNMSDFWVCFEHAHDWILLTL